ncbi:hypothetical protein BCR33DRAFT_711417 [Rhizoclosmatium globosum]|uniref:RRM domain-containing protein n=1 Tax=Rhizoclosmatium globosum TaxID=329046 RepID=A0A1Y2D171_9FUNG|nr:hypothetical protein BCR33DRAFT_711417 [Rhizoclosmatium globosum]|eukprot:ORY53028.1 hypothetical protein BCR33DRAFT_711417 [Rhizoclosmatium globosum]
MTSDQPGFGSQQPESSSLSAVKDDTQGDAPMATPRLESHAELKIGTNSTSPISPISPIHSTANGVSVREDQNGTIAGTAKTQHRHSFNNYESGNNRKKSQGNSRGNLSNRWSSGPADASDVKPYLAAPFQSDPAIFNAAAAAAAAAQASAPLSIERSSPTPGSTPLQYVSPSAVPRPPYFVYPNVMYYPAGQSTPPTPTPDASAFFNPAATSPIASFDSIPNQWAYPVPPNSYSARPPMMSPNPGRQKRAVPKGNVGQPNVYFSPPPPQSGSAPQGIQGSMPRSQYGNNNNSHRNLSDISTISNSSSIGGRSSSDYLGSPTGYNPHRGYHRRESNFSPNQPRGGVSSPTAGPASGSDIDSVGCTTNLYVRGLTPNATDESLYELCKGFGRIYSSKAILDLVTQECKGFGFVMYETEDETRVAYEGLMAMGYQVSYARTDPRSPGKDTFVNRLKSLHDDQSTNIYVSNLPANMDEDGLVDLLKPRVVVSAKILRDPGTLKSRGVGFARLETREEAISAIHELHGKLVSDSFQHLQARFADSVAQKRFKLTSQQQYANTYGMPMIGGASPYLGGQMVNTEGGDETTPSEASPGAQSEGPNSENSAPMYYDYSATAS